MWCIFLLYLYLDERRGVHENTSMRSRKFLRAQPEGTPEAQFFQAARGFSTVSQTLFNPIGQSWTFKTLKSLKKT